MATLAHALKAECPWQIVALVRAIIPLSLTLGWGLATGGAVLVWRPASLWIRSLAGSTALLCTFYSFSRLPVADVLTLTNLFPVWLALLSWPVLGQVPTLSVWLSVAVGISGVALIQQPHFAQGNFATLVTIFSSVCSAVAMLGLNRLKSLPPRAIVMHFSAVSLLFCLAACAIAPPSLSQVEGWTSETWMELGGMGMSATLGQFMLTKAFTTGVPAKVAVAGLTQVAFGMISDVLLFDRQITLLTAAGTVLVLAPTAWLLCGAAARRTASDPELEIRAGAGSPVPGTIGTHSETDPRASAGERR